MTFDSIRAYVQLATGLGDLTRARALDAAQVLLAMPGGAMTERTTKVAAQVSVLADELLAAAMSNRDHLQVMVRGEVEGAVERLGLASAHDLARAKEDVVRLRAQVAELQAKSVAVPMAAAGDPRDAVRQRPGATRATGARRTPAAATPEDRKPARRAERTATTKKAAAKKATTKKATTKKVAAKKATIKTSVNKSATKKPAAKAAGAKKSAAKNATATTTASRRPARAAFRTAAERKN